MEIFGNISNCQVIAFGNAENGYLLRFQSTDNQYRYSRKNTPNSTGKELDAETGFSYFGARYLDHTLITAWLSMDPMADKYPSISPYAYCAWNPIKLVDLEGQDLWKPEILQDGTVNYVAEKGDNMLTLMSQYNLNLIQATYLIDKMKNDRISGEYVEKITGSEVLKLNWNAVYSNKRLTQRSKWNTKAVYQLGFAILYNRIKNGGKSFKLENFFTEMPEETGANCTIPQWGMGGAFFDRTQESAFSIPALGGGDIPITFVSCSASSQTPLVNEGVKNIDDNNSCQLRLNVQCTQERYSALQNVMINVANEYEIKFKDSYGN